MTYFFAEDAAFDQFAVLSDALMGDRRTFAMPSVEQHYFTLTGRVANPKAIAGADVIPWRPARGVYLIIEQGAESPAVLTDIDGIAGLWWHDGAPPPALSTGLKDNTGLRATYCFLDGDPVRTGELLREPLQKRWATGNIKPLLAAPFQTLIPFEWDRYLP